MTAHSWFDQAMRSTDYTSLFATPRSAVIGSLQSSSFGRGIVSSALFCFSHHLLCFLIVGIHPPRITIPLSLLLLFW